MTDAVENSASVSPGSSRSLAWWQWLLMYPGLAVAVLGAIPTVINGLQAIHLGVDWLEVGYAQKQYNLAMNNMECLKKDGNSVNLRDNTEIKAAICDTGVIWVKVTTANNKTGFQWIDLSTIVTETRAGIVVNEALADSLSVAQTENTRVLCVFKNSSGKIIRRMNDGPGRCHDEQINPYTGAVTSAPTTCSCPQ